MNIPIPENDEATPIGEDGEPLSTEEIEAEMRSLLEIAQRHRRDAAVAWRRGRRMYWGISVILVGVAMWGSLFVADIWFKVGFEYLYWLLIPHYLGILIYVHGIGMMIGTRQERRMARWHEKTAADYERVVGENVPRG
jgi:hypothetical protein